MPLNRVVNLVCGCMMRNKTIREWEGGRKRGGEKGGGRRGVKEGGDIYGTGARNPWELSSLAYESNSNSRKRQTFTAEPVVRNASSRSAKS